MKLLISYRIERILQKLGFNDMTAFHYGNKYSEFADWVLRHPITIANVSLPLDEMPNNEYVKVEVSFDDMKCILKTGIWRKTYVWSAMAKVKKE